ncbi:MAG TPA: flagellar biosynthetic protein FliR [Candidatus Paceibacterota bacterium]|nr:flagellar biosynthetic protein FliR [Candidatus Paceibacterota bacterium]
MEYDYYNWLLVFLRLGAFLFVLPFFSATNFPVMMRIALGALMALLLVPMLPPTTFRSATLYSLLGVMAQEISVGLMIGFVSRMVFYAADLAGNIVATEIGLNMGSIFNPLSQQSSTVTSNILFFLAAIVMLTLDLHHWVLVGFQRTYEVLPIGGAHLTGALFSTVVGHTSKIFIVALQISAPILAVSFVVTIVFAVLSRAVPQMNVFILSFPFRIAGGLAVFGFTLQLTAQHVLNYLHKLPDDLLTLAQLMGG